MVIIIIIIIIIIITIDYCPRPPAFRAQRPRRSRPPGPLRAEAAARTAAPVHAAMAWVGLGEEDGVQSPPDSPEAKLPWEDDDDEEDGLPPPAAKASKEVFQVLWEVHPNRKKKGGHYYYNPATGKSVWQLPTGPFDVVVLPGKGGGKGRGGEAGESEEPGITDGIGTPDPNPTKLVNWCV